MFQKILKNYTIDPFFQLGELSEIYHYDFDLKIEMSHQFLNRFYTFIDDGKSTNAFYPSSNEDIVDIDFFNQVDYNFGINKPNLFIHSDSFLIHEKVNHIDFINKNINIKNGIRLLFNTEAINEICYLIEIEDNDITNWLILFSGKSNEDMIKELVKNKIAITYLYSKCDGILSGMGGRGNLIDSIGIAFYLYFYKLLETKFHITQFNKDWFNDFIKNDYRAHNQQLFAKRMYKKLSGINWDNQLTLDIMLDTIVEHNHNVENQNNLTIFSINN